MYIIKRTLSDCDFFWSRDAVMRLIYLYDSDLVLHVLLFCLLHKNSLLSTGFHCLFCLLTIRRLLKLFKEHTRSPIELRSCLFCLHACLYIFHTVHVKQCGVAIKTLYYSQILSSEASSCFIIICCLRGSTMS